MAGGFMHKLYIVKRTPAAWTRWQMSFPGGYARERIAGAASAGTLARLFDMVTMDGPVPEIETEQDYQAS
jgi:hypothetical protein